MATNQISLDLGFDRKGLVKYKNEDRVLLQYGFTRVDHEGNPVVVARGLRTADRLKVTLYDLTDDQSSQIHSLSLSLSFQMARQQEHLSPCSFPKAFKAVSTSPTTLEVPYRSYMIYCGIAGRGKSTVFEGEFPIWNVHPPGEGPQTYPANQLDLRERMPPRASFVIENTGSFYLSVLLDVCWKDASGQEMTKKYRVDPEMIVDTNGPVGEGIEH